MTSGKKLPPEVVEMLRRLFARTKSFSATAREGNVCIRTVHKYVRDNPEKS